MHVRECVRVCARALTRKKPRVCTRNNIQGRARLPRRHTHHRITITCIHLNTHAPTPRPAGSARTTRCPVPITQPIDGHTAWLPACEADETHEGWEQAVEQVRQSGSIRLSRARLASAASIRLSRARLASAAGPGRHQNLNVCLCTYMRRGVCACANIHTRSHTYGVHMNNAYRRP